MTLIAIGGAEKKEGDMTVLKRVLQEAKGDQSRVHVITTATALPVETKKVYEDAFRLLGVECTVSHIATREEANSPEIVNRIADADVIFFSGGDQRLLIAALKNTAFLDKVMQLSRQGAVVAGTSAGAAAASTLMISSTDELREKDSVQLAAGFSFAPHVAFDTHFTSRKRLTRLFNTVTANPGTVGIGLDEDTAVVMRSKNILEVVGSGTVTIVNGSETPLKLAAGDRYDLKKKKPLQH